MKKSKIVSVLMLTVVLALLCGQLPFVFAADVKGPGEIIDFTQDWILDPGEGYFVSAANVEYDLDNGYLHIVSTNGPDTGEGTGDPYMVFYVDVDAEEYPYMKIKLRNHSEVDRFQLHYAQEGEGIGAASNTLFGISTKDEEFQTYIIDMNKANEETFPISVAYTTTLEGPYPWEGYITTFRLDFGFIDYPGGQVPTGSEMDVEYVAFFDSVESAEAFTNEKTATEEPTEAPGEPTEAPEDPTEAPEDPTEAPATEAPTETDAPTSAPTEAPEKSGCGSVIAGGVSVAAIMAAAMLLLKKKEH